MGKSRKTTWAGWLAWPSWVLGVIVVASISFVTIDQNSIGHLKRIYLGKNMKPGQIIAFDRGKGPQARILGPGVHFIPLVRSLYKVEVLPVVEIPPGSYGVLKAHLVVGSHSRVRFNSKSFSLDFLQIYFSMRSLVY